MLNSTAKPAPHDRTVERSLLGVCLRDNAQILDVAAALQADDFYVAAHRVVWEAMTALYLTEGRPASPELVYEWASRKGLAADLAGGTYLIDLWESASAVTLAEVYVPLIRGYAVKRALIQAGHEIARDAEDPGTESVEALEGAEKRVFALSERGRVDKTVHLSVAVAEAMDRIENRQKRGESHGLMTGWPVLDGVIGGLDDGALVIVAARPSVGKTAFAVNLAQNVASEGGPVHFVSLEQSKAELAERLIASRAGVDSYRLRTGRLRAQDEPAVLDADRWLSRLPWHVDDSAGQTVLQIAANARRLRMREKIRVCVIDYLQLIVPDDGRKQREEQVSTISRRLKLMARELGIPVVCLAQLNRQVENRPDGRPRLSDLRESGAIEQDADVVLLLHKSDNQVGADLLEVIVGKNRNGPTGSAMLAFNKEKMQMAGLEVDHAPIIPKPGPIPMVIRR